MVLQRQLLFVFPPSMFQPETFRMGVTCTLLALPSLLLVSEVESNWLHIKYHHIGRYHRISSTYVSLSKLFSVSHIQITGNGGKLPGNII